MKRVCMVRNSYYPWMKPNRRNAETLVSCGYEVDVICMRNTGQKNREVINGVKVYRFPLRHHRGGIFRYLFEYLVFFIAASLQLIWFSLKKRYDVIEVSGMPDFMVFTAFIPKLMGTVVVINLYDHVPESYMQFFKVNEKSLVIRFLRKIEGISVRWVDYCLGTQIITKQKIEAHGVSASKISVILNVPAEDYSTHSLKPHKDNNTFSVMTHGSLLEIYGVQTLISATPLLVNEIPNIKVKIMGSGEYEPKLKLLAQSLGMDKYVDFLGFKDPPVVPEYLSQADIGVVTIKVDKNPMLPNKLFEYLDLGIPTVSASIPAITTYFDQNAVMFYEPGNERDLARCIIELYKNPEKRKTLANSGKAAYEKYRWSAMKYEYLDIFNKLCNMRR